MSAETKKEKENEIKYVCPICKKELKNKNSLASHKWRHEHFANETDNKNKENNKKPAVFITTKETKETKKGTNTGETDSTVLKTRSNLMDVVRGNMDKIIWVLFMMGLGAIVVAWLIKKRKVDKK